MTNPEISIVKNKDIDYQKWDQCIQDSDNSRVYAYSWYLDIVCPDWAGLIWGDYEYVMPLPFHKKFGISYLSQPVYAQQLGIFPVPTANVLKVMFDFLITRFDYIRLSLNSMNITDNAGFSIEERRNYILPLNVPYETITGKYNQNTKRNIRKSKPSISIIKTLAVADYMNLKRNFPGVEDDKEFQRSINIIISTSLRRQQGIIYSAYSSENELCAAAYFLFDSKRVSYLNAVSSNIGKEFCAGHAIVDQFIQDNAEKNILLDFEGSQNPGVARFYEGFGAECEHYQHLYRNTLIWPLRIFKK